MRKSSYKTCITLFFGLFFLLTAHSNAQRSYPINANLDILHYTFSLELNDSNDEIKGEAKILFKLKETNKLTLDLVGLGSEGSGMLVTNVIGSGGSLSFTHEYDRLIIILEKNREKTANYEIVIHYKGIPAAGLVIGDNIFDERVFFGDNYPDRARNWLPCVDHPSDKATVTWVIKAPSHYKVVASGKFVSEVESKDKKTTTWDEQVPLSTKVMTFGAANFAVDHSGDVNDAPVTTWVYQQNKEAGFYDFAIAPKVLAYYDSLIGPYPYEKLANVQSKTTYGGMENAGNIFYFEKSVNGKGERETLIAHEIVHQWFGNSATEKDWPHAWLSEGFATYLTSVYIGSRYGLESMNKRLIGDRNRVIQYWHKNPLPIVNRNIVSYPRISGLRELLSTNTYQKAGWVLHMLRNEIGDEAFWQSIRKYYTVYRDSIAGTEDFKNVVEEVSGKDLELFFDQWLYGKGQPTLNGSWQFENDKLTIALNQSQEIPFEFPLEIGLVYEDEIIIKLVDVKLAKHSFSFSDPRPDSIILDPNIMLLFEGKSQLVEN